MIRFRLLNVSRIKWSDKKYLPVTSLFCLIFYLYRQSPSPELVLEATGDSLVTPDHYDSRGCPLVPVSFSGMTGRLGNIISTYVNFIALEYRLGYKYHLPLYMNFEPAPALNLTKPFLASIFKNVSFPTAHWSNFSRVEISNFRDASPGDVMLFNNSWTGGEFRACDLNYSRVENIIPTFDELEQCARNRGVEQRWNGTPY